MGSAKTKPKKAKQDTRPKKQFNAIGQLALTAQALAAKYAAQIGTRLSATFLQSFGSDITTLNAAVPTVIQTKDGVVQLTAAQTAALETGYQLVKGIRTTVKSQTGDKDVLLAYGVGTRVSKVLVKEVSAAIQTILARIKASPAEAASFDIVQADIDALNAALAAIQQADKDQEQGRAAAPQATKDRNAAARRLLDGIKKIAGAGMRSFPEDATIFASFEALVTKRKAT
jgi:hypothetical protein